MDGYRITAATARALEKFRATLPPVGALLKICPPGQCHCDEPDVIVESED